MHHLCKLRLVTTVIAVKSLGAFQGRTAMALPRHLDRSACSHGNPNHHLNTLQLTVKRMRNWPLLPLATEVKQRRKKERKLILPIWGRKGKVEGAIRVGWGRGEEHSTCINNWSALKRQDRERERQKQIRPIRWCTEIFKWMLLLCLCITQMSCVQRLQERPHIMNLGAADWISFNKPIINHCSMMLLSAFPLNPIAAAENTWSMHVPALSL